MCIYIVALAIIITQSNCPTKSPQIKQAMSFIQLIEPTL